VVLIDGGYKLGIEAGKLGHEAKKLSDKYSHGHIIIIIAKHGSKNEYPICSLILYIIQILREVSKLFNDTTFICKQPIHTILKLTTSNKLGPLRFVCCCLLLPLFQYILFCKVKLSKI
jgi:hypothetical protein